ncbi:MAG: cyanophycin synthetase, partial [Pirellulales bacterium]|nr:cyanophycin synthetase [Pirellulales bacterium]
MEFRRVRALRGPNVWANFPVLEALVDLGPWKDSPSDELPGFNERLMRWLPSMIEHRCSVGERGGFFERLRRGTYQAHILEHVTLELQTLAGTEVGFGRARETDEEGVYRVAIEYEEEDLARAALETGRRLCLAAIEDRPFDVQDEIAKLRIVAQRVCLGPSTRSIVRAAQARGVPFFRLNDGSLVQLGYGARQRRILAAETDRTGAIAESIAQDKELTKSLLRAGGIPVPDGRQVTSAADAWTAACDIGLPVVVKPKDGSQGRGVATNLRTLEQVQKAYQAASENWSRIVVERHAPGDDYRMLVVGDRLIAAARREPAKVIGDGVHTVAQLVEIVNCDPRRGDDHATSLSKIYLDELARDVLDAQGLHADSVPETGRTVLIRRNANLSTGGTAVDVTDWVHPEVAARAIEAARIVGLDIAGVDIVATDVSRPLEEQGGVIVEVNAAPGLRMHLDPSQGQPRPVGEAIVRLLFAPGDEGRIPLVAVTGTNGKTTTARLIAHCFRQVHPTVGLTCTDGIFLNDRRIDTGDCAGPLSARNVLTNPLVDAAVFETARGGILRAGLGFDRCDVAVVTNIGEGDHLGIDGVDSLEKLAKVKRTIVDVVAPKGYAVLNAADPHVAPMSEKCPGGTIFFCRDEQQAALAAHRERGGRATFVREGEIVLAQGAQIWPLCRVADVPITRGGGVAFMVDNALAAAGAAWGSGLSLDLIRRGLTTFGNDFSQLPGRFNMLRVGDATIIVDYGHNYSALEALVETIAHLPNQRRTVVYSAAGDRRDEDMIRQGRLLGDEFDRVILYEDHYLRGRASGEIIALFRQGLRDGRRVAETYELRGSLLAVESALEMAQPGELL